MPPGRDLIAERSGGGCRSVCQTTEARGYENKELRSGILSGKVVSSASPFLCGEIAASDQVIPAGRPGAGGAVDDGAETSLHYARREKEDAL